jgi:chromosome segregation ATPase
MTRARLRLALIALTLSGCAALRGGPEASPERQLEQGLSALEARDYNRARALLDPLYRAHWEEPVGQRAMLALIAAELDSRNPERQLAAAADLSARYLNIEDIPGWHIPLAESLYLMAQELGANEERLARAEANAERAQRELAAAEEAGGRELPTLTRETVPQRIRRLTAERDSLQRRLAATEQRLAARDKELNDAQTELERIRKTLKP